MLRVEAGVDEVVIQVTAYEVLLSSVDWESHTFSVDDTGETRWTACGEEFGAALLEPAGEDVPTCFECALKFGAQVAHRLTKETEAVRAAVMEMLVSLPDGTWDIVSEDAGLTPDVRALFAAQRLAALDTRAVALDGPAHTHAVRALRARSKIVLMWTRWEQRGAFLLPVGLSLSVAGIWDVVLRADSWWAVPALIVGIVALCVAVVGLWLANQQALRLAVGAYLEATPRLGDHGNEIE